MSQEETKEVLIHKKVEFRGEIYWLHGTLLSIEYILSPLHHYSEEGELLADPFNDISYAFISDGVNIQRFGEFIGTMSELKDV